MPGTTFLVLYVGVAVAYGMSRDASAMSWLDLSVISLLWPADFTRRWIELLLELALADFTIEAGEWDGLQATGRLADAIDERNS